MCGQIASFVLMADAERSSSASNDQRELEYLRRAALQLAVLAGRRRKRRRRGRSVCGPDPLHVVKVGEDSQEETAWLC